ncbi:hypothetical protein BpsS140_00002 [Bacillus phage vB_BpsS-140]|nr:hypothetical protein BpsS140_00002 [Bacillus phage vB_BpsS-140]
MKEKLIVLDYFTKKLSRQIEENQRYREHVKKLEREHGDAWYNTVVIDLPNHSKSSIQRTTRTIRAITFEIEKSYKGLQDL